MELEYSDRNSRRSKVYIAVGIIVALIVGGVVFVALQASDLVGSNEPAEIRTVVVAVRNHAWPKHNRWHAHQRDNGRFDSDLRWTAIEDHVYAIA